MVFNIFKWISIAGLILGFYVWEQTQKVRLGYRVEALKHECERWDQDNTGLSLTLRKLMSLERLDQFSREKKLVIPDEKNVIFLK
jgi:hypothetical protein